MVRRALAAIAYVLCMQSIAFADDAQEQQRETLAGGAWHAGKFVPCADGSVTAVHARLDDGTSGARQTFASGVVVEFKLPTAPKFLNGQPVAASEIVHYDGEPTNKLMQSEKVGDRIQVCFIGFPTTSHDPQTGKIICDPNDDPRGMQYRVYDYKRHAAYMGPDSQHGCGGA